MKCLDCGKTIKSPDYNERESGICKKCVGFEMGPSLMAPKLKGITRGSKSKGPSLRKIRF